MIAYFFYSSMSLALLLFVYRILLENEKRFTFNRIFLLWSLVFSFVIPLIPVPLEIPWSVLFSSGETVSVTSYQNLENLSLISEVPTTNIENSSANTMSETLFMIAIFLYATISALLFFRLIRNVYRIQLKITGDQKQFIQGYKVVLLNEEVTPHTFLNTIFLNRKQFERGEIPEEVLNHEFTHVRQKHSLDILFVEILKIIFWFNPLLYLYKTTIALNHEYLADEAVLSNSTVIKEYQYILLKTMEEKALHGLASSFNFSLTKRRLQMMTQSKTKVKFLIKFAMLVPFFTALTLILGCEPTSNEITSKLESVDEVSIEILDNNSLQVNETTMTLEELENYLSELPERPGLVRMEVSSDAQFGMVTDIQNILKKHLALRIKYSSNESNNGAVELNLPSSPYTTTPLEAKNLMKILMNSFGDVLMNEEPVEIHEIRENINQFVDNLASSPSEAVIVIKTTKETPYDKYIKMMNEIEAAYGSMRDVAAQNQFGVSYTSLSENSTEKEAIQNLYPMRIITSPPSTPRE